MKEELELLGVRFVDRGRPTDEFLTSRMLTGSSADMTAAALSSIGMGHVAGRLDGNTAQECAPRIQRLSAEAIAR